MKLPSWVPRRKLSLALAVLVAALAATATVTSVYSATTLLVGSTPIIAPIAQATQPTFIQAYPDTTITIQTNQAKKAVLNNVRDVGLAHTDLVSCTVDPTNGDDCATTYKIADLNDIAFGRDAVVVIVNVSHSGVTQITKDQIKGIYEGTITNWSALGGASQTLVPRAMNTGGTGYFGPLQDAVGFDSTKESDTIGATGLSRLSDCPSMIGAIAGNAGQIGYCGIGWVSGDPNVKTLAVASSGSGPFVSPTNQTVTNGTYPMYLTMHVLTLKDSAVSGLKPRRLDYMNFMLGDPAQQSAAANHFVSTIITSGAPTWDVNIDHTGNILDVIAIGNYWGQQTSVAGWIRQDANHDGKVNILDIITVGNHWKGSW